MRCEFFNKLHTSTKEKIKCPARVYGKFTDDKAGVEIVHYVDGHNHQLYTVEEVEIKLQSRIASIDEDSRKIALEKFLEGQTISEIYDQFKRENKDLKFGMEALHTFC